MQLCRLLLALDHELWVWGVSIQERKQEASAASGMYASGYGIQSFSGRFVVRRSVPSGLVML